MVGASSLGNSNHELSLLWVPLGSGPKGGDRPRSTLRLEGLKGEGGQIRAGLGAVVRDAQSPSPISEPCLPPGMPPLW